MKEKGKNKGINNKGVTEAIVKVLDLNYFDVRLNQVFQLICKASLIFKLNLELPLSVILKERELYKSMCVLVPFRFLKT